MRYDVVIVGSGISSLTCAALLSKRGKSVCVLEQHTKPGGYMHCFSRLGERFDTGAHYVGAMGEGQPFRTLLKYLGVFEEDDFVPLDAEGFDVFRFPGFEINLPQGYARAATELAGHFPRERDAVWTFLEKIRTIARRFVTYEFDDRSELTLPSSALETPLSAVVESLTANPSLRCVLYAHCALHGVRPQEIPFGLHAVMVDSLLRGAYGLRHGGDALAARFVREIERNGGKVRTGQRVSGLRLEGREIRKVVLADGDSLDADWVISGIHPKATFRLLSDPDALTPAFRERMSGLPESAGIFGIYTTLAPTAVIHPLRNYYYFRSINPETLLDGPGPGDGPESVSALFAASAQREPATSSQRAPGLPISIHLPTPAHWFDAWKDSRWARRPAAYGEFKERIASSVFALLNEFHPGFRDGIGKYVTSSPLSSLHFNGSEEGSAYGIYHSIRNTGPRALGPRTKVLNLLLTGQSSLFPGLLGASVSGLRTAGHILGIKPILTELKRMRERSAS